MALFTIGDLHLSLAVEKPMDIFGGAWQNYTEKIEKNWKETVKDEDTVVILGDISWGISLEECKEDFLFIDRLPGKKYIIKGNHDYYWTTVTKMNAFLDAIGASTMCFIFNSAVTYREGEKAVSLCGTRGWFYEEHGDDKIYKRELGRLETSLKCAESGLTKLVFMHYPPFEAGGPSRITSLLEQYGVKAVYYGHLHGRYLRGVRGQTSMHCIHYELASADYLNFKPLKIEI